MSDAAIFVTIILLVITFALVFTIGIKQLPAWSKTKDGKGAIASMTLGVVVILIVCVVLSLFSGKANAQSVLDTKYGYFLNSAYVFAGIDYTNKISTQCVAGSQDDRMTSNMGFGLNLWESISRNVTVDLQYTHHSCVIGVDRNSYDGIGIKATITPWRRYSAY